MFGTLTVMGIRFHRRSTRLKGYDYSKPGWYYITICTKNRLNLFGTCTDGIVYLNDGGKAVLNCWNQIPMHYQNVQLHQFIIMPNHVHGIIEITSVPHAGNFRVGVQYFEPLQDDHTHGESIDESTNSKSGHIKRENKYQHIIPGSLGSIIRGFEIGVTKWFRVNTDTYAVWQRNFHDTIIRSPKSFRRISNYIKNNPKNWEKDEFNT